MSAPRPTEEIVARLARDLAPVQPVAPLRRQALAMSAAWFGSAVLALGWIGLHPLDTIARGALSAALLAALAWIGVAGAAVALAARRPGRERVARAAALAMGLGVAAVAALALCAPGAIGDGEVLAQGGTCSVRALWLAIPCGLLAAYFARGGAPWRPHTAGAGAALGAVALGALLVHASCVSPVPAHWIVAHALVPLASGAFAGALLAGYFARRERAARRALARTLER